MYVACCVIVVKYDDNH